MENNLPLGWELVTLNDLSEKNQYGFTASSTTEDTGVKFLRITDIQEDKVTWHTVPYCKISDTEVNKFFLREGDIVFARTGATVGKSFLLKQPPPIAVFASYLIRITLKQSLISDFVYYFFKSSDYWKQISNSAQGIGQPNVNAQTLSKVIIPLPPLAEQKRIVAKLDAVMEKVEASKERLARIPEILKQFRQSVLAAAVSGRLTAEWRKKNPDVESAEVLLNEISRTRKDWILKEYQKGNNEAKRFQQKVNKHTFKIPTEAKIPISWAWASFTTSCQLIVDCHNKTAPYISQGVPLVRTSNIRNGKLDFEGVKYVDEQTYKYWAKRCPPMPGDLLFTREAPMGEVAIIPEDTKVCMGQRMMLLRCFPNLLINQYLLYTILDTSFQRRMNKAAFGTGVKHLRVGDVEGLAIPIAPFLEQQEIVHQVEKLFTLADSIQARYEAAKAELDQLPQAILAKAFRGELVPQDPNDEPASLLLERIQAEKSGKGKASKAAIQSEIFA